MELEMPARRRQKRQRVTIVDLLPKDATPAQRAAAERKLELATMAAAHTPEQTEIQQRHHRRGGKFDGKSRHTRTRHAQRESAKKEWS